MLVVYAKGIINGCEAKPPGNRDAMGCDESALDQKQEKPGEKYDSVGSSERRKRRVAFSGMDNRREEGDQRNGDHRQRHPGKEPPLDQSVILRFR